MASVGVAQTNSGSMVFVYNNFQSTATYSNVNANTNSVVSTPTLQGFDVQSAKSMTNRGPGGGSYHLQGNSMVVGNGNANAVMGIVGGDFGLAAAQMGFTKGMGILIASNSNGTSAVQFELNNSQVNTNSYYGDTTLSTVYCAIMQNLASIDGVTNSNAAWTVDNTVANGVVGFGLITNTNGNYAYNITAQGGTIVIQFPNGIAINAASSQLVATPVNGGVFAAAFYGS